MSQMQGTVLAKKIECLFNVFLFVFTTGYCYSKSQFVSLVTLCVYGSGRQLWFCLLVIYISPTEEGNID